MIFWSPLKTSNDLIPSVITHSAQLRLSNNNSSQLSKPTWCSMNKKAWKRNLTAESNNLTQTRQVFPQLSKFKSITSQTRPNLPPTWTLMTKTSLNKKRSQEPKLKVLSQTGVKALRTRSIVTVSPSAHMPLIPIMLMVCARIATMPKEEQRWLPSVNTPTALCMQKVSAATATSASTIRLADKQRKSMLAQHPLLLTLQFCNKIQVEPAPSRNLLRN